MPGRGSDLVGIQQVQDLLDTLENMIYLVHPDLLRIKNQMPDIRTN